MRLPFSSPRKRSPDLGSTARLPKAVLRGPSAKGITTRGATDAFTGSAPLGSSQKISAAASPRQPWLRTTRRPDAVSASWAGLGMLVATTSNRNPPATWPSVGGFSATVNAPIFLTGATVDLEAGGQTGRQQFRVPTYIYVIEGILTTFYESGPVGIAGAQYHAAGQSFMDNGGWWHNHTNRTDKPGKYLMLHIGYPGRPAPVQKPEAE